MKLKPPPGKAKRTLIAISREIKLEGYMMPDGSYRLNPTSLARAIGKNHKSLGEFLGGKSPQAQSCQGFSLGEIESIAVIGENHRIKPIPLYVAAAFLRYWDKRGNEQASAIVEALTTGHLITLFDDAFGVKRSAWERQEFIVTSLSPDGVRATQQIDATVERLEKALSAKEGQLALSEAKVRELSEIVSYHTDESLEILQERLELQFKLQQLEERYENLLETFQELDEENRRLQRQVADISQEAVIAWKKVGMMHEQKRERREQLLAKNGIRRE